MTFEKYCEDLGYDPGMDMTRETRIKLAVGYAKQENKALQQENEELQSKITKALEHSEEDIRSSLRVMLMVETLK